MRKGKFSRFLALLLAAVMLLGAAPLAIAAEEGENYDDQVSAIGLTTTAKPDNGTTTNSPFPQGTAGSNSFRIPAMVTLSDGTIVAAADARWNTTYDGGGLDTIVARSSDNGANWNYTFANYLGDNGNTYNGSGSTCFIDPALAVTSNDTIYMLCDLYPYGVALNGNGSQTAPSTEVGFNSNGYLKLKYYSDSSYSYYLKDGLIYNSSNTAVDGYTVDAYFNLYKNDTYVSNLFFSDSTYKVVRTGYLYLTTSTDKGATWSAPTLLNLKTSSEQVCLVGPGRGLVTKSGMIVFPVYSYNGSSGSQMMGFIYSMDGVTWIRSANFTGATWSSEAAVVGLSDGTLRFFYRNETSCLCYVDYNNGWGSAVKTDVATNSNTQISAITYSKTIDGKQVILVSCPTGPNGSGSDQSGAGYRQNGKIFVFTVESDKTLKLANSVAVPSVNSANSFMYSCLTELKDGSVAILYEDNESGWGTGDDKYYQMSYKTYAASELGVTFDSGSDNSGTAEDEDISDVCKDFTTSMTCNGTQTLSLGQSAEWTTSNSSVVQLDSADTVASYAIGTVSASAVTLTAVGTGTATITAQTDTATYSGTVTVAAANDSTTTTTVEVTLKVGETSEKYTVSGEQTATVTGEEGIVDVKRDVTSGGTETVYTLSDIGIGDFYVSTSATDSSPSVVLNITKNNNGTYTLKNSSGDYIYPDADIKQGKWNYKIYTGTYRQTVSVSGTAQNGYAISRSVSRKDGPNTKTTTAYLTLTGTTFGASGTSTTLYLYKQRTETTESKTTFTFTGAKPGTTEVTVGNVTYKITVNKVQDSASIAVGGKATFTKAGTTTENYGDTSIASAELSNGTLTVTGLKAGTTTITTNYGVYTITVNEGEAVSIKVSETKEISVDLTDGQYVKWASADSHYVGVAGNYDSTSKAYTNTATIVGNNVTATDSPVVVTGTVYNADGTVTGTHKWLVTVTEGDEDTNKTQKTINISVDLLENCDVYYSINGGELIKIESTGTLDIGEEGTVDGKFNIMYFAAPKEGYALTYMNATDTDGQYYTLSNGNPDGTDSNAWPFADSYNYSNFDALATKPDGNDTSVFNTSCGMRWGLAQGNFTVAQLKILYSNAIALGCDGVTTQTKNGTEGLTTTMSFVAQKLPEMKKTITSVTHDGTTTTYTEDTKIEIGDTINYTITVYSPVHNSTYGTVTYSNINVNDSLINATWTGKGTPGNQETVTINEYTFAAIPYTYTTSLKLTTDNFSTVVKNGKITNTATMSYDYKSNYSNGNLKSNAVAEAAVTISLPSYVIDFGLPVEIDVTNLVKIYGKISTISANYGTATLNGSKLTYTPNKVLPDADTVTINLAEGGSYAIHIIPASNVLYEENFLTDSGNSWTMSSTASTATQTAESTDNPPVNVFGYDAAYASANAEPGVLAVTGLTYSTTSSALTTEFYGNAFDLIGTCGPDTGRVMMLITNKDTNNLAYLSIFDTRFNDTSVGNNGYIYQVPLAHVELGDDANYLVSIYASGSNGSTSANNASTVSTISTYNNFGYTSGDGFDAILSAYGLSAADVTYVGAASVLSAYGIAETDTDSSASITYQPGTHVEIDSFRVYRSSANTSYPESEQNVEYVNIIDLIDGEIAAYTEPNDLDKTGSITKANYETIGGPENEIYLRKNQAISFSISNVDTVHISLRAVSGSTSWNNTPITSNTEMYYVLTKSAGIFTITNTGDNLLAIGNVKAKTISTAEVMTMSMLDEDTILNSVRAIYSSTEAPVEPEVPAYEPFVKVDVKSVNVIRNKLVTVTITTSTDVKTLTINGKTLKPTNSWLVKMGWSDTYTYVYVDTVKRGTTRDYEIIATNSDGLCCTYSTQG